MSKQTTHQERDVYQVYQKNFGKYFSEAERTVPQYFQSVINQQKTFLNTWRNTVEALFDVQRKYSQKAQINTQIPEASTKAIDKATDRLIKVGQIQEQYAKAALDVTEENIKSFYESAEAFADFYNNIVESWFTSFKNVRN
ncbi:MAG: hypothetical protein ACREAU_07300 [Nitrosopumilaceae archaeon]